MDSITVKRPANKIRQSLSGHTAAIGRNITNNIHFYKKGIVFAIFAYFILLFGIIAFTGFCSYTEGKGLVKFIQNWIIDIFGGSVIDDVRGLTYIEFNSSTNTFNVGGIAISTLGTIISSIYKVFKNLGYMLLIAYLLIGLMEDISFNQLYAEKMVKKIMFFCIGLAVIAKSMDLVYFIANIGSGLVNKISTVAIQNMPSYDTLCQEVYDKCTTADSATGIKNKLFAVVADFTNEIGYILQLFIPWLVSKIAYIIVQFTCWSRFLEVLIIAIISPVSFADISKGNGDHSNAMRAVKNVIALSLSGAMILLICIICNQIQGSLITTADFGTSIWNCVLISVVQMGLVHRANDIVKQGLGMA